MTEHTQPQTAEAVFDFHMFTPQSVKDEYLALAKHVSTLLNTSEVDAAQKIRAAEKIADIRLYGIGYSDAGYRKKLYRRKLLTAKNQLQLLQGDEAAELEGLKTEFEGAVERIVSATDLDAETAARLLEDCMVFFPEDDLAAIERVVISGPEIRGFDESGEYGITNEIVQQFLLQAFGVDALRFARIGIVKKDDDYLILIPNNADDAFRDTVQSLVQSDVLARTNGANMVVAADKDNYLKAARALEGKSDDQEPDNTYKVRATSGNPLGYSEIDFHTFSVEQPNDFDYLDDLDLDDEKKMLLYILGTIVHEVVHRWESHMKGALEAFRSGFSDARDEAGTVVTDYVKKHRDDYGSHPGILNGEDIAEAVRLYVTNPKRLQEEFPKRYQLVKEFFPMVPEGVALDFVKQL